MSGNEGTLYHHAARFPGERAAGAAYFQIQKLIEAPESDLSVYRFQLHSVWHVAIVGHPPGKELVSQIEAALASGEATALPEDILRFLQQRRAQQQKHGPWVERHYRPGQGFRFRR